MAIKKVIYVNTYAYKGQHEVINAALLSAICEIFEEIKFIYKSTLPFLLLTKRWDKLKSFRK